MALMTVSHTEICLPNPIPITNMKARVYVLTVDCYLNFMVIEMYNTHSTVSRPYSS